MLQDVVGGKTRARVMLYLFARDSGNATEIARFFGCSRTAIQNACENLEEGGVLSERSMGAMRVYEFNRQNYFYNELLSLVQKGFSAEEPELQVRLGIYRGKPRRKGKEI